MDIKKRMHQHHKSMMKSAAKLGYVHKYTLYGNTADVYDDPEYLPMKLMVECITVQHWLEQTYSISLLTFKVGNEWFARVMLKNGKRRDTFKNFESQGHALLSGLNLALRVVVGLPTSYTNRPLFV